MTEDAKAAAIDGYTLAAPEAQTVTVSEKDQVASTSFVNAYTEVPSTDSPSEDPTASPSGEPTPGEPMSGEPAPGEPTSSDPAAPSEPAQEDSGSPLARTGAFVGIPLVLALAAIAGGVLLAYRRRA